MLQHTYVWQNVIYCEGSVLRRWKRNWFVLYTDGILKYFDSPDSHVAEEAFLIPTRLLTIKTANLVATFSYAQLNTSYLTT